MSGAIDDFISSKEGINIFAVLHDYFGQCILAEKQTLPQKRGHAQTAQTVFYEWMCNSCSFELQRGVLETLQRKWGQDQTIPKTMF